MGDRPATRVATEPPCHHPMTGDIADRVARAPRQCRGEASLARRKALQVQPFAARREHYRRTVGRMRMRGQGNPKYASTHPPIRLMIAEDQQGCWHRNVECESR
jgi:hypothetical protein